MFLLKTEIQTFHYRKPSPTHFIISLKCEHKILQNYKCGHCSPHLHNFPTYCSHVLFPPPSTLPPPPLLLLALFPPLPALLFHLEQSQSLSSHSKNCVAVSRFFPDVLEFSKFQPFTKSPFFCVQNQTIKCSVV